MVILIFLSLKRIMAGLKKSICINVFCYENCLVYPVHVSNKKFENCMQLLFITDENKSHYVYIKDFNRFMCRMIKNKNKKYYFRYCLQCSSREKVLMEHKEVCLMLNGKQNIKLRSGSLKFQNYFKQLAVSFKIYADFEPVLKGIQKDGGSNASYTKKYQEHIPCSFAYKVVCIDDRFSKSVVILQRKKKCSQQVY